MFKSTTFMTLEEVCKQDEQAALTKPSPLNFMKYLPWACAQCEPDFVLIISKRIQREHTTEQVMKAKPLSKIKPTSDGSVSSQIQIHSKGQEEEVIENTVKITATYDKNNMLVQIKFDKYSDKPLGLLKIIKMISPLYPTLTSIVVEPPICKFVPIEISHIIQTTNITEVSFDGCFVSEYSFHLLLAGESRIKSLSLARCHITDAVLEVLCPHLVYSTPASENLNILNLASNKISDLGAKYIAHALRSNRKLYYLNLSDNTIGDEGVRKILDVMHEFPLTDNELLGFRRRRIEYIKSDMNVMDRILTDLRQTFTAQTKKKPKSAKSAPESKTSFTTPTNHFEDQLLEKARSLTLQELGKFDDPFSDTVIRNGINYYSGNNTLQILNLAYNDLTFISLKHILGVLVHQNKLDRRPIGLFHIQLNGNRIPNECNELRQIEEFLEMAVNIMNPLSGKTFPTISAKKRMTIVKL